MQKSPAYITPCNQTPRTQSMGPPRPWVYVCGELPKVCQNSSCLEGCTGSTEGKCCALEEIPGEPRSSATGTTGDIPWGRCSKAVLEYDNHRANEEFGYAGKALLDKIHNETRILKDPSYFCLNSLEWRLQKNLLWETDYICCIPKGKGYIFYSLPTFFVSSLFHSISCQSIKITGKIGPKH